MRYLTAAQSGANNPGSWRCKTKKDLIDLPETYPSEPQPCVCSRRY